MNPILLDIKSELVSDRLLLRMPMPGDGQCVNEAIKASIDELQPWMPFAQKVPTVEETEINIREAHTNFLKRDDLRYLVFHKENGEFIASTGLHRIDWGVPKFEIGYWIDTRFSGKGYVTEAVKRLIDYTTNELKAQRLEIRCESTNMKSRAIPEKLGFELEGTLRQESLSADGKRLTDTCIYAKLL